MADKKDEKPSHIADMERVKANFDEAELIANTLEVDKGKLYHLALDKIRDSKGRINYKLLDADKNGDKFHHAVADEYIKSLQNLIVKNLGITSKLSDMESKHLVESMYGETKKGLLDIFAEYGSKYTVREHKGAIEDYTNKLRKRLANSAIDHLKADSFSKMIKEMKADKHMKVSDMNELNKPYFRDDVGNLINSFYRNNGSVSYEDVKSTNFRQYIAPAPIVQLWPKDSKKAA